jgi:hypothetical protein
MAATLIGQNGPGVRHHAEVGCKNESGTVQTLFQMAEEIAEAWALILRQEPVIHSRVQVSTFRCAW